jgi:hypothetical protein
LCSLFKGLSQPRRRRTTRAACWRALPKSILTFIGQRTPFSSQRAEQRAALRLAAEWRVAEHEPTFAEVTAMPPGAYIFWGNTAYTSRRSASRTHSLCKSAPSALRATRTTGSPCAARGVDFIFTACRMENAPRTPRATENGRIGARTRCIQGLHGRPVCTPWLMAC